MRDEEAKQRRRDYLRRYRADRARIDYMPSDEAVEAIRWRIEHDDISIAGAIDDLIVAGYKALDATRT